eukprot:CAMPEP_0117670506 /NCGR_PEP_ID=MMETSP0804-20121206/12798_1 /TAXON_ID=1074897 /ORGANISM="Tetraselmis astigmatica, Strain CCMP880" /LENGTH=176 /DNA_ID=CAMNT_0005478827 /DNA_START=30 /DNA_END=560 /DNA_ORIENTATION=+
MCDLPDSQAPGSRSITPHAASVGDHDEHLDNTLRCTSARSSRQAASADLPLFLDSSIARLGNRSQRRKSISDVPGEERPDNSSGQQMRRQSEPARWKSKTSSSNMNTYVRSANSELTGQPESNRNLEKYIDMFLQLHGPKSSTGSHDRGGTDVWAVVADYTALKAATKKTREADRP